MNAQRVGITALRRVAARQPSLFVAQNLPKLAVASQLASTQIRTAGTTVLSDKDGHALLAEQRLRRPVSPHLTIYKTDQTWFTASIWTRITGSILSGGLYVFATAYLAAPLLGWHVESASLAAAVAAWPVAAKGGLKFLIAWPFTFHAINGCRHLVFDTARGFVKGTFRTQGWAIWGASLVTALGLVAFV